MKATRWQVFRDKLGWYLATVHGKPSCRMANKDAAVAEAARRNARISAYQREVLEGNAGRLPVPTN
jgi:hypothetical protein